MSSPEPDSRTRDARWVEGIRAGNEEAFEEIFRTFFESLYDFTVRRVDHPEVAEELVQNVLLNLWSRRERWEPRHSVKAYLYGAVRNEVIKYLQHRDVVRRWHEKAKEQKAPGQHTPDDVYSSQELEEAIRDWVDELPERRKLVFVLSRYHGLSNAEVAVALGISVSTVEVQMWKALRYLRAKISRFHLIAA